MLMTIFIPVFSQGYHVRIGFVGNSITIGSFLSDPVNQCYPSQLRDSFLRVKYGDTCIVGNFAVSGRTMLKTGDYPIWNEQYFKDALHFAPNILFIMLGTNDSKPYNWDAHKGEFYSDFMSMIDTFKKRNPDIKFILCLPPPAFKVNYDIRDSVIVNGIIPLIDSVAKTTGADTLDLRKPFLGSSSLFPDGIHPNVVGAHSIAKLDFDKLLRSNLVHKVDTNLTFVTSFITSNSIVKVNDSVNLSWTTANADSVFINGKKVDLNGSKYFKGTTTTVYTLLAIGKFSKDSMQLIQTFYNPALVRISISPKSKTMSINDSVNYYITYIDQYGKYITNTNFNVSWNILTGSGTFKHVTSTMAIFFPGAAGTATIQAKFDTVASNIVSVTINQNVNISQAERVDKKINLYPNPANDILNFELLVSKPSQIKIKIYDLKGTLLIDNNQYLSSQGNRTIQLKINGLVNGIYLYQINYSGKQYNGNFNILKK